jgi:ISXO2-like transposase domain
LKSLTIQLRLCNSHSSWRYVRKDAIVNTDEHAAYKLPLREYKRHDTVTHSQYEYARHNPDGTVSHVNTCESWNSLIKRGVFGSWHVPAPLPFP